MDAPLPYRIFSGKPHSLCRRSDVGNPRLALMLGHRLSDSFLFPWHWCSSASCRGFDNPYTEFGSVCSLQRRFQTDFLRPPGNGDKKTRVQQYSLFLMPVSLCGSVVPYCLRQLSAFLPCFVPVSAFAFRLSR